MTQAAIKSDEREAAQMFERGVAAAKGGQRRVAAVLLARAVQLDPRHELGWLWLSGVLDDPDEIAFCLRSVLAINSQNERAQRGLAWLERRALIDPPAEPAAAPPAAPVAEADPVAQEVGSWWARLRRGGQEPAARPAEPWWVGWRSSRREMSRARLLLWAAPLLLLALTLVLNLTLRAAVERNELLFEAELAARAVAAPQPTEAPAPAALPEELAARLEPVHNAELLAYLSALDLPRARLRDAAESYRNATSRPGGSSVGHAAAARRLRDEVERAYAELAALTPPPELALPHAAYLAGLEAELAALDDMLAFYSSFNVEHANRAALHMEEAGDQLDQATQAFGEVRGRAATGRVEAQSIR